MIGLAANFVNGFENSIDFSKDLSVVEMLGTGCAAGAEPGTTAAALA
jgi:hypothetical protein